MRQTKRDTIYLLVRAFRKAFPRERAFRWERTEEQIRRVVEETKLSPAELLTRIELWHRARPHLRPWELKKPPPRESGRATAPEARPELVPKELSEEARAWLERMESPFEGEDV